MGDKEEFLSDDVSIIIAHNKKKKERMDIKGREEMVLNNLIDLNHYLSSGTIKGVVAFTLAKGG